MMTRWRALATLVTLVIAAILLLPAHAADPPRVIIAFGDSLTAGLGVAPDETFPALLQERLRQTGSSDRVLNAGVSGDTTAGALRRVDWTLRSKPDVVIVALGANDGLRGQDVAVMRQNLEAIVTRFRAAGARVLLCGMRVPPNYGEPYAREFAATYPLVARRTGVPLMPFLLDGVAADSRLNQADGIHPNAAGHRLIAERLWPHLEPLLRRPDARPISRRDRSSSGGPGDDRTGGRSSAAVGALSTV